MTQIIYVASPDSQQIYVWKLDNTKYFGILKLIQIIFTPGQAQPIAIHPNKRFLYVGVRPNFKILTYSINQSGLLKYISSIKIDISPTYLISNKQGTFLYCASYLYNTVVVFPIHDSGIIKTPIQIIENLIGCHSIGVDIHKELLWIPCLKENSIRLFTINKFGFLVKFNPYCIKNHIIDVGPRHITFHHTDCYAYVINELNSTVNVINYSYSCKNPYIMQTLNLIPKSFIHITQYWGSDIHITPNGCWLYCADRIHDIISIFNICAATKQLKFVNYQFTEKQPRGFAIDFTGKFLIVAGQKSHHISLYYINLNNGRLTILSRYYSGQGPMWIKFLVLNDKDNF